MSEFVQLQQKQKKQLYGKRRTSCYTQLSAEYKLRGSTQFAKASGTSAHKTNNRSLG